MKTSIFVIVLGCSLTFFRAAAQEVNNLVLPPGTAVANPGELGRVEKVGSGPTNVLLIADAGFGAEIYHEFMQRNRKRCTFYAITLPGSDNTNPPTMPPAGTSYAEQNWLLNAQQGILNLIEKEKLKAPVIAGNLIVATSIALNLALRHPDKFSKVIILGGVARATWPSKNGGEVLPEERAFAIDNYTAPQMYKSMTLETWKRNLYQAIQFSKDTTRGNRYFKIASEASIPVMTRYLCEFYATDIAVEFERITVPTLIILPGFDEKYLKENGHFRDKEYLWEGWSKARTNPRFQFTTIPDARLFLWIDQPEAVSAAIVQFLSK